MAGPGDLHPIQLQQRVAMDPVQHYREHRGRILQGLQLFGGHDQHDIHDILHLVHIPSELFAR